MREESSSNQRHGALHTGEALGVPLPLFKRDVLHPSQACDGHGAAHTLLCIEAAEAIQAVRKLISGGEALPCQLLLTPSTQEALPVPGLVMVRHPTSCYGFFTGVALVSKLLLKAWQTKVTIIFRNKRLGSYWLLTAMTQEAGFMPRISPVLHFAGTWHDGLLAGKAFGGVLLRIAICAKKELILGSKELFH